MKISHKQLKDSRNNMILLKKQYAEETDGAQRETLKNQFLSAREDFIKTKIDFNKERGIK